MKKSLTFIFLFVSVIAFSQNNGINFQGVGRNSSGTVLATQKISLRFSVIQTSETGTVEYVESKEITTNAQGIFSVVIGDGTQISKTGNFSDINWKIIPKFLKVEMDPSGGSSFATMGTTRLQSVPFAYYANGVNADNVDGILSASKGGTGVASISALKNALGVDQINNTSDLAKPISTATQAALDTKVDKVESKQLSTNDYTNAEKTKLAAISGTNTGDQDLSGLATISQLSTKANTSDLTFKAPNESPTFTGTVSGITKTMVGLSNVANTADLAKPISTATQEALDTKVSTTTFSTTIVSKENSTNKSTDTDLGASATSDILFPTQKAVKTYVDGQINSGGVADGGITTIKLATGAVTDAKVATGISKSKVGLGNVENTALSSWTGSANITEVGTILSGTWSGTAIEYSKLNLTQGNLTDLGLVSTADIIDYYAGAGLTSSTTVTPNGRRNGANAISTTFEVMPINESLILDGAVSNVKIATGISKSKVGLSNVENTALSTWAGSNYLTTLGTINSGTWSGTAINYSKLDLVGSIVSSDISSSAAINYSKLNLTNSIISGDLTSASITTSKLADASVTNTKISGPVSVVNGGTGTSTLVTNSLIVGNGTNTVQFVAPGASGNVLKSDGTSWISDVSSGGASSLDNLSDAKNQGSSGSYNFTGGLIIGHKYLPNLYQGLRTTALGIGSVQNINNGDDNTAFGYNSMKLLHQGDLNTAVGSQALYSVYSGSYNVAVGFKSLFNNTASQNVAIGYFSLVNNTTGSLNTAVGSQALQTNVSGVRNTAIGHYSLGTSTGDYNTATGFSSLYQNTTGYGNSGFGLEALASNTTGFYNTSIGYQSGMSMTSGNNNTLIGYNSQPSAGTVNNEITLGNSSITTLRSMVTSITSLSDRRDKTDIIEISEGINFIKQLKPVSFTWNTRDKSKVGIKSAGFIAQDLLSLQKSSSIGENLDLVSENNPEKLEARYNNLLPVMVKAIQDQQTIIDQLKKELAELKQLIQNK